VLVISRRPGQVIEIGCWSPQVRSVNLGADRNTLATIQVLKVVNGQIRLGFEAAADYWIYRQECLPCRALSALKGGS